MKKKILIINRSQFGYLMDSYFYCRYANKHFQITYIGFDADKPKVDVKDVDCLYVSRNGSLFTRYLRFFVACLNECKKNYDVIFLQYFVGCFLLKLLMHKKKFVLDIRSRSVVPNIIWNDIVLRFETLFFANITVVSQSIAEKLKLQEKKYHVLPLGAEYLDIPQKAFGMLKLLYVGTFSGRRIEDTVYGFARFYEEYGDSIKITYDIVGDGYRGERERLINIVREKRIEHAVSIPGYIHQSQLKNYYHRCNLGVSYIPINEIYDCQPPTKTYEYLLAGMPVLATSTKENTFVINANNGVLIRDSSEDFYKGLISILLKIAKYNSAAIKKDAEIYTWKNIINKDFIPYIEYVGNC